MMSHCVSFITHFLFLIYHLIHQCCSEKDFLESSSDFIDEQLLTDLRNVACCSDSPHVYKEAVLPQEEKDNQVQVLFLAQLVLLQGLNSTILITASGFVINSHQGLDHFDYIIGCVHIMSAVLGQCKVIRGKKFSEKYINITNIVLTLKVLIRYCLSFAFR